MARLIAEDEGLPPFFLAKTLQGLARQGLLRSSKGPTGGFRLSRPPEKVRLLDVIEAVDGAGELRDGLAYLPGFKPIRASLLGYLKTTTIADLVAARVKARGRSGGGTTRRS